ncbi:uncharacterized protein LOC133195849 [Saccostrea echinata]|uniref:uncharacterized protein LOC133195849 n=1 Tax=Saccostrea echinata TaxID=191078 RepID=UPI002A81784B|nr:uncharacterized protein LOC133195849 [Saccostrea echinata]
MTVIFPVCGFVTTVHVKVRIDYEDGSPVKYFEEDLTEEDFREKPPFEMVDRNKRASYDTRPPESQKRFKRDIFDTNLEVREKPECDKKLNKIVTESQNKPIQLAYVFEPGENVKLMCHFCGDVKEYRGIIEWKRLIRQSTATGKYIIQTVEEDTHDVEALNHVRFTMDHSLVIMNVTHADADTYFCIIATQDQLIEEEMDAQGMKKMFLADISNITFRLYYHVDVIRTSKIPARRLTYIDSFEPEEEKSTYNMRFYTDWKEWSSCSVCGKHGERKRHGVCTVQLINPEQYIDPAYIYYALKFFKKGIPCRSTMFDYFGESFITRADEIQIGECTATCKDNSSVKFSRLSPTDMQFRGLDEKAPEEIFVKEGHSKILTCKGASLDDIIYWLNNSEYMTSFALENRTSGRITIDVYGNLMIKDARRKDSGLFECWVRMRKTRAIKLTVRKWDPDAWKRYLGYLMYSYFVNFCVFLALILVKHWHRQVQLTTGNYNPLYTKDNMEDEEKLDNFYVEKEGQDSNVNALDLSESKTDFDETITSEDYCVKGHDCDVGVHHQCASLETDLNEIPTPRGDGNTSYTRRR